MENTDTELNNSPVEADTTLNTQIESKPVLTKEQQSKLDSFDRIYAEGKEAKEKLKKYEVPAVSTNSVIKEEVKPSMSEFDPLEAVKLGKALKDFDEDETSFIIKNAKSKKPEDIISASKDSWVSDAIQARRTKVAKEKQILGPSSPGATPTFSPKSPQEIAKMPKEEYDKYLDNLKNSVPSTNQGI
jgi:hypothetical protein